MDINYEYYKVFYYVGKYRNITKAAQALGGSQPNVTRVMKLLEGALGCQLLLRSNKGITFTEKGELLYERVSAAFLQLQTAEEELGSGGQTAGTIVLGTTETALHLLLFQKLKEFKRKNPKVRFKIYNYSTKDAVQELIKGAVEISIVTSPVINIGRNFACKKLLSFREGLVCGSNYRELALKKWHLKELSGCPWVCLGKNTVTYDMTSDFFLEHGIMLKPDIEVATSDLMIPMIKNNLGIGYVPEPLAQPELEAGTIFEISVYEEMAPRLVCAVYDLKRVQSRCEKEFLDFLE